MEIETRPHRRLRFDLISDRAAKMQAFDAFYAAGLLALLMGLFVFRRGNRAGSAREAARFMLGRQQAAGLSASGEACRAPRGPIR